MTNEFPTIGTRYFVEGTKRTDYILVVTAYITEYPQALHSIVKFLKQLYQRGIDVEVEPGITNYCIYIKLALSDWTTYNYAHIYNVTFSSVEDFEVDEKQYLRKNAKKSEKLWKDKPRNPTQAERILVCHEILRREDVATLPFTTTYPLHEELDLQRLKQEWASYKLMFKAQPLDTIHKYFGSEIAFYFAWVGFYNKMLGLASLFGILVFAFNLRYLVLSDVQPPQIRDICESEKSMCPICGPGKQCQLDALHHSCFYAKLSYVLDNHMSIVVAIFISIWGTMFLKMWRRRENSLKLRWNLDFEPIDTEIRDKFRQRARWRVSKTIPNEVEPYEPLALRITHYIISTIVCSIVIGLMIIEILAVTEAKMILEFKMSKSSIQFFRENTVLILMCAGCLLQVILIKLFAKIYGRLSIWLAEMENPRTQMEFDVSVTYKRYFLAVVNNYTPLCYILFLKGRFWTIPFAKHAITNLELDSCPPTGCTVNIAIQLAFILLLKSLIGNLITICKPALFKVLKVCKRKKINGPQWEKDFYLRQTTHYQLTDEFMEMVVQYGFVIFYSSAFPLAPLCALINNAVELRVDAAKLVKRCRRPVPRQMSGIRVWHDILHGVTTISSITNATIIAFTVDVVAREIYKMRNNNSLDGFIKSTLSVFSIRDYENHIESTQNENATCYYRDLRYPPDHENKYELTSDYWYQYLIRMLLYIGFEHSVSIVKGLCTRIIPDTPASVDKQLYHRTKSLKKRQTTTD